MTPPQTRVRWAKTCRLVPSRYPTVGVFDRVASPDDLPELFELEGWTNDRLSTEVGLLHVVPSEEWVVGPMSSVVMAAFCHPPAGGARFTHDTRGGWYAARTLTTALAESIHRRAQELAEIGMPDTRLEMRLYHADFDARFHDLREHAAQWREALDPTSYERSQDLGQRLFEGRSNGIVYPSVRDQGECLVSFRPKLVTNVQVGGHFEYRWDAGRAVATRTA